MKQFIREIAPYKKLYRDNKRGVAWIEEGSTGPSHSCHPNIDASGSVKGMKNLSYWGKRDRTVRSHGWIYNVDRVSVTDELDRIAEAECRCIGCLERRAI